MSIIKRIEIKNWIGIEELAKDLGKINFISGPKGAGKTSFIEAIEKAFTNKNRRTEVIRHGENEASIFIQTSDGLEINRKIRDDKADYMKVSKPNCAVPSTEKFLRSLINGDVFRPLDFVEKSTGEQAKIILNMLEIDWTMDELQKWFGELPSGINYECHILQILKQIEAKYYAEREVINRDIRTLEIQVKTIKDELPPNYDGEHWRNQVLSDYYSKLHQADENNKKIELAKACIEGLENKTLTIKAEAEAEKAIKKQAFDSRRSKINEHIADLKRSIEKSRAIIDAVDSKVDQMIVLKTLEMEEEFRKLSAKYEAIMLEERKAIEQEALQETESIKSYDFDVATSEMELENIGTIEETTLKAIDETTAEKIKTAEAETSSLIQETKELKIINTEPLKKEAEEVANMQSYLRQFESMQDIITNKLAPKQEQSDLLTAKIEKARELPQELLKIANVPIPGLSVDGEGCIRIGQTLISDLSEGEQLELAFKVAKHQAGELKVICVDGINKINPADRDWIKAEMQNDEFQYFVLSTEDTDLDIKTIGGGVA